MTITSLKLTASRYLVVILTLIGLNGVIAIWFLPLSGLVKTLISLFLSAITWRAIQKYALLKKPDAWLGLRLNSQQQLVLFNQQQESVVILHADSVVTVHFILLRFRYANRPSGGWLNRWHHLIIMSDACDVDILRQWRVWLLWGISQAQIAQED